MHFLYTCFPLFSPGQYRCGPASLAAVKRGEIRRPYDVSFVFAEVQSYKT